MNTLYLDLHPTTAKRPPVVDRSIGFCRHCGRLADEHEQTCSRCEHDSVDAVSQFGEVYSYTTIRSCKTRSSAKSSGNNANGGNVECQDVQWVLALIQLSNGALVTGKIVPPRGDLHVGLRVKFVPATASVDHAGNALIFSPVVEQRELAS
ncbi:OB-fold domain-containing protein [Novipirellula caenicola]|uniref:DUF35 domain-containing protein n=1 Tax=Novipirellula caenicola TaxID=1536901 RepID=A0ABP9VIU7_9BACT